MSSAHVLFEDAGQFKAGTILQDSGPSLQVETASGKRTKVKQASVMLRFGSPGPAELMSQAQQAADAIDPDFLWECAPQDEFEFETLAADYFGEKRSVQQVAGLLLKLHSLPVYFYRKGKGRYRPAQPDTLKAALAAVERRRLQEAEIESLSQALIRGECPPAIRAAAVDCLLGRDRNSVASKAVAAATQGHGGSVARLLLATGAFADARAVHEARFLGAHFPGGTAFAADVAAGLASLAARIAPLPDAAVEAFSIDNETTTEIDDCLSVTPLDEATWRVGIHIAAPGLAIVPDDPLDRVARERMTTVYAPGAKITMLPAAAIAAFSLDGGTVRPALSLYIDVATDAPRPAGAAGAGGAAGAAGAGGAGGAAGASAGVAATGPATVAGSVTGTAAGTTMRIVNRFSRADRVRIVENLRHEALEPLIDEAQLEAGVLPADLPRRDAFDVLWRLTTMLSAERERVRGRRELRGGADFDFRVDDGLVSIRRRRRDAPLDRIVAEMMIVANSTWGRLLADHRVAGLYRSQAVGRVRMSTHPLEHQGLGVAQYAWSTSPLRRYADLVNQMQLLALLDGRAAPFDANDATLFGILSAFEARYAAVAEYQQTMERYWCLRWIGQHPAEQQRFAAVVSRDDTVRLADAPLYLQPTGCPPLPAGARLTVEIVGWDELDLTVSARVVPGTISTARGGETEALVAGGEDAGADVAGGGVDPAPASDGVVDPASGAAADPGSAGGAFPATVPEPSDGGR